MNPKMASLSFLSSFKFSLGSRVGMSALSAALVTSLVLPSLANVTVYNLAGELQLSIPRGTATGQVRRIVDLQERLAANIPAPDTVGDAVGDAVGDGAVADEAVDPTLPECVQLTQLKPRRHPYDRLSDQEEEIQDDDSEFYMLLVPGCGAAPPRPGRLGDRTTFAGSTLQRIAVALEMQEKQAILNNHDDPLRVGKLGEWSDNFEPNVQQTIRELEARGTIPEGIQEGVEGGMLMPDWEQTLGRAAAAQGEALPEGPLE